VIHMPSVAEALWDLINQGKYAEVAVVLFSHHKNRIGFWVNLKAELLCSAKTHPNLFLVATLLDVSSKDTLEESFHLVPGLSALIYRQTHDH